MEETEELVTQAEIQLRVQQAELLPMAEQAQERTRAEELARLPTHQLQVREWEVQEVREAQAQEAEVVEHPLELKTVERLGLLRIRGRRTS